MKLKGPLVVVVALITVAALVGCSSNGNSAEDKSTPGHDAASVAPSDKAPTDPVIDGGEYTWDSTGITLKIKIKDITIEDERYSLCGDDDTSCGVIEPGDLNVQLKYTVIVPDNFEGKFEPSLDCEPNMSAGDAEDDVIYLAGEPIEGIMLPGSTKTGVSENVVSAKQADETFAVESTCGADESSMDDETAYFIGKIPSPTK